MATEEKVFKIPLREDWVKKPRVARVNRSVDTIRLFLERHTKTGDIKLSQALNESLWTNGAKKPPAFAKVKVVRNEKGKVIAMLPEEKLEFIEKKGLKHKLLRRKGDIESKIVKEAETKVEEPPKPADVTQDKKEAVQTPKPAELSEGKKS